MDVAESKKPEKLVLDPTIRGACEYLTQCRFVRMYKDHYKVQRAGILDKYCKDWWGSEDCARKIHLLTSECGCQPTTDLMPNGEYIN